jgi:hypothetical protein
LVANTGFSSGASRRAPGGRAVHRSPISSHLTCRGGDETHAELPAFCHTLRACPGKGCRDRFAREGGSGSRTAEPLRRTDQQYGDYIGQGQPYSYSKAEAEIAVTTDGAHLTIMIEDDEHWRGEFRLPDAYTELQPGSYPDLERFPFHDPSVGGLSWTGEGRGCNSSNGWLIIDSVTYDGQTLTGVDLQFEQHCEYFAAALHGEIHWDADDATSPPGPVVPLPSGLWEPSAGSTPATGNYVYLGSQQGDYIGIGGEYLYTQPDSTISVNAADGYLSVFVGGNEEWYGDFQVMNALSWRLATTPICGATRSTIPSRAG